jgi:hypothetical protein
MKSRGLDLDALMRAREASRPREEAGPVPMR